MHFMRGNEISLYRMSAQLIPLATHEYTDGWAWWDDEAIRPLLEKLGELIRKHAFRELPPARSVRSQYSQTRRPPVAGAVHRIP